MSRTPDIVYHGYEVFTMVVPLADGHWSATSEISINGADGKEVSQGFGGPCQALTSEAAKAMAIADVKQKIDDLLAEP